MAFRNTHKRNRALYKAIFSSFRNAVCAIRAPLANDAMLLSLAGLIPSAYSLLLYALQHMSVNDSLNDCEAGCTLSY
jgi:hypothetical protein